MTNLATAGNCVSLAYTKPPSWENFFTNLYRNHIDRNIDTIIKSPQEIKEKIKKISNGRTRNQYQEI